MEDMNAELNMVKLLQIQDSLYNDSIKHEESCYICGKKYMTSLSFLNPACYICTDCCLKGIKMPSDEEILASSPEECLKRLLVSLENIVDTNDSSEKIKDELLRLIKYCREDLKIDTSDSYYSCLNYNKN